MQNELVKDACQSRAHNNVMSKLFRATLIALFLLAVAHPRHAQPIEATRQHPDPGCRYKSAARQPAPFLAFSLPSRCRLENGRGSHDIHHFS